MCILLMLLVFTPILKREPNDPNILIDYFSVLVGNLGLVVKTFCLKKTIVQLER